MEEEAEPSLDSRRSWIVCAAVTVMFAMSVGYTRCFGILFLAFQEVFSSSAASTATIIGIYYITFSIFSLVACNVLLQKFQARSLIMTGGLISATAIIGGMFVTSIQILMLTNGFLVAVGASFIFGPAMVSLTSRFERHRTLATGIAFSGSSAGGMVLPIFVQFLLEQYGYGGTMLITGAMLLHIVPAGMLLGDSWNQTSSGPDTEHAEPLLDKTSTNSNREQIETKLVEATLHREQWLSQSLCELSVSEPTPEAVPSTRKTLVSSSLPCDLQRETRTREKMNRSTKSSEHRMRCIYLLSKMFDRSLLTNSLFYSYMLFDFFAISGMSSFSGFLPPLAKDNGIRVRERAILVSLFSIMDLVSKIGWGFVADKGWFERYRMIATALLILGTMYHCVKFYSSFPILVAYAAGFGIGCACYYSVRVPVIIDFLGKERFAACFGISQFIQGLSLSINYPVVGAIRDYADSYIPSFHYLGTCFYVSGMLLLLTPVFRAAR